MQNRSDFSERDWAALLAEEESILITVQVGGQAGMIENCSPALLTDHICRVLEQVTIHRFRKHGSRVIVIEGDDQIAGEIKLADLEAVVKVELTRLRRKAIQQMRQRTLDLQAIDLAVDLLGSRT